MVATEHRISDKAYYFSRYVSQIKDEKEKSRFTHSPTAMFCFTISCLHIKFSIWSNTMIELILYYGSTRKIRNRGALWPYKLFYCIEFFGKHNCCTILEIVSTSIKNVSNSLYSALCEGGGRVLNSRQSQAGWPRLLEVIMLGEANLFWIAQKRRD